MIKIEGWEGMLDEKKAELLERLEIYINRIEIADEDFKTHQKGLHILVPDYNYFHYRERSYIKLCSTKINVGNKSYYIMHKQ